MTIADVTPDKYRFTIYVLEQILVHPVFWAAKQTAAKLMRRSPWIPLFLGITTLVTVIIVLLLNRNGGISGSGGSIHDQVSQTNGSQPERIRAFWKRNWKKDCKKVFQLTRGMLTVPSLFLLATFSMTSLYGHLMAGTVFNQFIQERFRVDLPRASELLAHSEWINMGGLIFNAVVFGRLPELLGLWFPPSLSYDMSWIKVLQAENITICCFCALFNTIGFLVTGLPGSFANVIIGFFFCAGGQSFRMAVRSMLTDMILKKNFTGLFMCQYYLDILGGAFNSWVLAASFKMGLSLGDQWVGLPFYVAASMWAAVMLIVCTVYLDMTIRGMALYKQNDLADDGNRVGSATEPLLGSPAESTEG